MSLSTSTKQNVSASALLQRPCDQPMAYLTASLNGIDIDDGGIDDVAGKSRVVSQNAFLNHVFRLANALPEHQHAINLCDNRYLFLVSLCAVIVKGGTNLLPPNKNVVTQAQLHTRYTDTIVLHDAAVEVLEDITDHDISTLDWLLDETPRNVPQVSAQHLAAISFTSGSTGESKPNLKYWHTLIESSAINAQNMLQRPEVNHAHVATVPGQHMWGFETSVLLPMFANVSLVDARPFFPHDILRTINALPCPCTLVSAPLHLKALSGSLSALPSDAPKQTTLTSILCATAPLEQTLAAALEQQTGAELHEVYGCSEVGSMAVRRTAKSHDWRAFKGLAFTQCDQGHVVVSAPHLPVNVVLEDTLKFTEARRFTLAGRDSDQIKVAGKRGSLAEANAILHRFEGLLDGVVLFPTQTRAVPRLVAIVSLADGVTKNQLRQHMNAHLDSAFVPRPIYQVSTLPREENGKLSRTNAMALYNALSASA